MDLSFDTNVHRQQLRHLLYPMLQKETSILAVWEGGSAARGELDEHSDLDVCVLVEDDHFAYIWEQLEASLEARGVEHRWVVPPGRWPGVEQRIYAPAAVAEAPFLLVDVALFPASRPIELLERERHGTPVVIFDRSGGRVAAHPLDMTQHEAQLEAARQAAHDAFEIYQRLARKELVRGRPLDADGFYRAALAQLRLVLGARHRPERFDFGSRYLHRDLPANEAARLERLTFMGAEELGEALEEMVRWMQELR